MILTIKNLGALKEAEIDLSKDLILLCGHNNTGKTYVAYAIANFLDSELYRYSELPLDKNCIINYNKENIKLDILKFYQSLTKDIIERILPVKQEYLYEYFGSKKSFKGGTYELTMPSLNTIETKLNNIVIHKNTHYDIFGVYINKYKGSLELGLNLSFLSMSPDLEKMKEDGLIKNTFVKDIVTNLLFYKIIGLDLNSETFFFTSERAAINIFSKELALNKNKFFDKILKTKGEERNKLLNFAEENINRYVKPIADELLIAEDLLHLQNGKSEFEFLAIELEKSILEGRISVGQYGGLQYQPNFYNEKEENIVLEIYQTSSLVKSLASLVFYLRHLAKKNDCIIIDEPELNLHPDNQILVARFLARLVNEGFKVVASTHSDYIIRELSNLLMLSNNFKEKEELMKTYGYNENELLKNEQVGVYYFEKGKNTAVSVPLLKRGIEIDSIDLVIANLNERSDDIYYTFLESDENKEAEKKEAQKAEENLQSKSKI